MKKPQPKMGRPIGKIPDPAKCAEVLDIVADRIVRVLRKHKAPPTWGRAEGQLLFSLTLNPEVLSDADLLRFAKLYVQAKDVMIDAMPQVRNLVRRHFQNGKYVAALVHITHPSAWHCTAKDVADRIKGGSVTENVVENARTWLRSMDK